MPELSAADVELHTNGRLLANDPATVRMLKRAYAAVRTYCNWHVSPSKTETITLDGPDGPLLGLPTQALITLTSVVEDGVSLNVANLTPSATGRLLVKRPGMFPTNRWSAEFRSIVVTMTHGFDVAPDFEEAVLAVLDEMWSNAKLGVGAPGKLTGKQVDVVNYTWSHVTTASSLGAADADVAGVTSLLSQYQLVNPY